MHRHIDEPGVARKTSDHLVVKSIQSMQLSGSDISPGPATLPRELRISQIAITIRTRLLEI